MAETNVGGVGYTVRISGDTSKFLREMDNARKSYEKFEAGIDKMVSRFEQAISRMEKSTSSVTKSARNTSKATQDSFSKIEKSITPTIGKLEDLTASYNKIRREASRVGNTEGFAKIDRAMAAYNKQARTGFESTAHMREATTRLSQEMNVVAKETRYYESTIVKMQNSIGKAEREVATLTARMTAFGASEQEITPLNNALQRYREDLKAAGGDATKVSQANNRYNNSINQVKNSMEVQRKSIRGASSDQSEFVKQMQNSSKAVQLALGPLSGIAARITAFTSLVRTNTVSIAGFTASITGLVVATNRIITVGIEYERQLLNLEASITDTGRATQTTVQEMDELSRSIASATLTSSTAARNAINILMTFQGLATETFEDILLAAQGVASAFGGNLVASTRLLARAIEQPSNSLDSLRRVGIQLNDQQKELIKTFESTGQVARAQAVLMDRISVFQARATAEAQGLAGQLDAVGDNFQTLLETISQNISANDRLADVYQVVNDTIVDLIQNQDRISNIIEGVSKVISVAGKALTLFVSNIELVVAAITGVFAGAVTKGVIALTRFLGVNQAIALLLKGNFVSSVQSAAAAIRGKTAATLSLATASRGLLAALGPVGISLAAAGAAFAVMTNNAGRSQAAMERVSKAQEALSYTSGDAEQKMKDLSSATGEVTDQMVRQAQVISKEYERNLQIALNGAGDMWAQYAAAIDSELSKLNQKVEQSTRLKPFGDLTDLQEERTEIVNFRNDVEAAFETVTNGGQVSEQAIESLKDRAVELGLSMDFIESIEQLSQLSENANEAKTAFEEMAEAVRMGQVDSLKLLEGMNDAFGDLLYNTEQFRTLGLVATQQQFVSTGDTAMEMYRDIFQSQMRMLDAQKAAGEIGFDEWADGIDRIRVEWESAALAATEYADRVKEARLEGVTDAFTKMAREISLVNAETQDARAELERMYEVEDKISSFASEFEAVKDSPALLEEALKAANAEMIAVGQAAIFSSEMISTLGSSVMSAESRMQMIREALASVSDQLVGYTTNTRSATTATKQKEQ